MKRQCFSKSPGLCPKVIATLANGFPVYAIYGAEGEGEGEGGTKTDDKTGEGKEGEGEGGADSDDEKLEGEAEITRLKTKLALAEKHRKAAEKKVADAEKEKLNKQEKAELEAKEAKANSEGLAEKVKEQSLQIEFFASDKFIWHNRKAALKLLDLEDVEISDDGDVTGLDKAIDKLAKDHPYLVKPKETEGEGEGEGKGKGKSGSSGSSPKNKGGSNNSGTDEQRKKLEAKYPNLRGRVHIPS